MSKCARNAHLGCLSAVWDTQEPITGGKREAILSLVFTVC
jgi:hypothetical protein